MYVSRYLAKVNGCVNKESSVTPKGRDRSTLSMFYHLGAMARTCSRFDNVSFICRLLEYKKVAAVLIYEVFRVTIGMASHAIVGCCPPQA